MEKSGVSVAIHFEDQKCVNTIAGNITISATETITVDEIEGTIFFEARGRMASEKESLISFTIEGKKKLHRNEVYEIPFSVDLSENLIPSYKGKNVDFSYKLTTNVFVSEKDLEKLDQSLFTKIGAFISSNKALKFSEYFTIKNTKESYKVKETTTKLNFEGSLFIKIASLLLVGGVYAFFIPELTFPYFALGIILVIITVILTTKYLENILGEVSLQMYDDAPLFKCIVKKTRKFNLGDQKCYYEVIERVVDDRGTSSSTYTKVLYKSAVKSLRQLSRTSDLEFNYPDKLGLQSVTFKDAAIIWKMHLHGKYLGVKLHYTCSFIVN